MRGREGEREKKKRMAKVVYPVFPREPHFGKCLCLEFRVSVFLLTGILVAFIGPFDLSLQFIVELVGSNFCGCNDAIPVHI
jgi:hypothetical protein